MSTLCVCLNNIFLICVNALAVFCLHYVYLYQLIAANSWPFKNYYLYMCVNKYINITCWVHLELPVCFQGWPLGIGKPIRMFIPEKRLIFSPSQKFLVACSFSSRDGDLRDVLHLCWHVSWYRHCSGLAYVAIPSRWDFMGIAFLSYQEDALQKWLSVMVPICWKEELLWWGWELPVGLLRLRTWIVVRNLYWFRKVAVVGSPLRSLTSLAVGTVSDAFPVLVLFDCSGLFQRNRS